MASAIASSSRCGRACASGSRGCGRMGRRGSARITWCASMRSPRSRRPRSRATCHRDRGKRPADHFRARAQSCVLHLRRRARLSARRQASGRRHVRDRFSGYPDCRDDTIKAMQVALNLGMDRALRHPYAADVDRQGGDLCAGARARRRRPSSTCWSRRPTPAISATARIGTIGAMAAANARPAGCAPKALPNGSIGRRNDATTTRRQSAAARASYFSCCSALTIPSRQLDDRACRDGVHRRNGPCLIPVAPGLMAPSGVHDGRRCAGAARSGPAPARRHESRRFAIVAGRRSRRCWRRPRWCSLRQSRF